MKKKTNVYSIDSTFEDLNEAQDLEILDWNGHKPIQLFPRLYNIKPCLNQSHPTYHPDSLDWERYWTKQRQRCIEGFWFEDKNELGEGGWRYMPPHLYFYINFCVIEDEGELGGKISEIIYPLLRDVEWMFAYGWLIARRFSGFEKDKEYTCHRIVKKIQSGEKLSPKEKLIIEKGELSIYKEDGSIKTYIDAKEYLYKTHESELGLPLYENEAQNFFVLGSRGGGKSYFTSGGIIAHEYNFSGQTRVLDNPEPVTIFVGAAIADKSSDLLKKFEKTQERLKEEYGSWGKDDDFIPGFFFKQHKGTLVPNNASSAYRNEYDYVEGNIWKKGGTGTKIVHKIYSTENPQAAVGNRCTVMVCEEIGLCSNLLLVHGANETTMIRKTKFGSALYIGTGGNMDKIIEPKIIFTDPEKYNFIPYKDVWEGSSNPIGFFLPAYYVDNSFKDENGNTNIKAAFAEEVYQRKLREKASNSLALDSYLMARPIVPSEMFLSANANVFPVAQLRKRESEVEMKRLFEGIASIGNLEWNSEKNDVIWKEDMKQNRLQKPIRHLNLDLYKGNLQSAIVVYEHPVENIPNPTYQKSLYKVTYDPVRDDDGGTSLGSILVYKGITDGWNDGIQDGIVAEWIGRYDKVDQMHEIAIKLSLYYNAYVLFENNLPGFKTYCAHNKWSSRLMMEPKTAVKKAVANPSFKHLYGVDMTPKALHIQAEQWGRQWLLEDWQTFEDGSKKINIDKLYSPRLIRELSAYEHDKKNNFDHVSSFKLLMIWLHNERQGLIHQENDGKGKYDDINKYSKSLKQTYSPSYNRWFDY